MKKVVLILMLINLSAFGMLHKIARVTNKARILLKMHHVKLPILQKSTCHTHPSDYLKVRKEMLKVELQHLKEKKKTFPFFNFGIGIVFFGASLSFTPPFIPFVAFGIWHCNRGINKLDKQKGNQREICLKEAKLNVLENIERDNK